MKPSFSILMLSFNQVNYLETAINSVLSQYEVDLELIIIDPGSTDGSRELLKYRAQNDKRIRLVFEADAGPADGLRKGWLLARNEIVGCLNSDDSYLPHALKRVFESRVSNPNAAVLTASGYIYENGKYRLQNIDKYSSKRAGLGIGLVIHQSTFYVRKKLDDSYIVFNNMNKTCWDAEILMDVYDAGLTITKIRDCWGIFRIHSQSITGSRRLRETYLSEHLKLAERAFGRKIKPIEFKLFQLLSRVWAIQRRLMIQIFKRRDSKFIMDSIIILPESTSKSYN
jgi:glycosyltransferase involved in cell wall biosynthesis